MMKEDPMMGFLLLIVAAMTGMLNEEQTSSLLDSFGNLSPDNQRKALEGAPEGYGGSFRGATGSAAGYTAPAPDESKFNYDLLDPQKFQKATIYPVKNQDDRLITSEFGPRSLGYGSKNHPACDFRAAAGMEVVSMFDGKVVKVGQMTVTVQNDNGTTTTYMHVDAKAKIGDEIKAGDTVAKVLPKCSRSPYDPHLDVRTIDSKSGIYINPEKYMDYEKMGVKHKGDLGPTGAVLYNPNTKQFISEQNVNTQLANIQANTEAKKLTSANISLQDQKVEGWPPGVDKSVVDAMVASKTNNIA
jgi:biotin carboxyl carrier protein